MSASGCSPAGVRRTLPGHFGCLLVLVAILPVTAAEPPPPLFPPPAVASPLADLALSVHARKALQEDPELGKLILGIVAENGRLRLWGPVPSEEIGQRVVKRLEGLKGVRSIQNDLRIVPPEPDTIPLIADPPAHTESASPGTALGPNLPEATSPAKEPARPSVALLPPVAVREPLPNPERSPAVVTSAPREGVAGLAATLDGLRRREERFRTIQPELRGGTVRLGGTAARGEDAMEFARLVAQLPGVERVVLDVRVAPAR